MKTIILCLAFIIGVVSENISPNAGAVAVQSSNSDVIFIIGGRRTDPLCFNCPDDYTSVSEDILGYNSAINQFDETAYPKLKHPRVHHTAVSDGDSKVFIFGGAGVNDDIEIFDFVSNSVHLAVPDDDGYSWTPRGDRPCGRWGHGSVFHEGYVYIFGGIEAKSGNALNDMWTYNTMTNTWEEWPVEGWLPQARAGFSVAYYQDAIYVFGGFDVSSPNKYFNDLWKFDLITFVWQHVHGSTPKIRAPVPRAYHASGVQGNFLFVHGGVAPSQELNGTQVYFGDFWSIDLEILNSVNALEAKWWKAYIPSDLPKAGERAKHASVCVGSENILFFSGVDSSRETLGDVWSVKTAQPALPIDSMKRMGVPEPNPSTLHSGDHDHEEEEHADWDKNHGHFHGHQQWKEQYAGLSLNYYQEECYPGYFFPYCVRDCSANDWCSNQGECLADGSCCCDAGYFGDSCENNLCVPYRGFTSELLNEILLPKSLEATYMKLDAIAQKLETIRDLLPNVQTHDVNMDLIAQESFHFYQSCLVDDLCETTECFEELIGCDVPCGTETFCLLNDICVNNQCINGTWRDCSEEFTDNKCVHSWCDETHGCMHSTISCDDEDACTEDYCDPMKGCVHETNTCGSDCCMLGQCNPKDGTCEQRDKCEDSNPCTIDTCNDQCQWGACEYEIEDCCYLSKGQYPYLNPTTTVNRPLGDPLYANSYQTIPPQTNTNQAKLMFWLRACDGELIYDIEIDTTTQELGVKETGAHIYGTAEWYENAGVVYTLPMGPVKKGVWKFAEQGVRAQDLIDGKFYVQLYFSNGDARAQIEFIQTITDGPVKKDSTSSFRG